MIPFLRQVASVYAANERENLLDYCFVFPNKRSATFFTHFMHQELGHSAVMPCVTNITDFVAGFSPLVEANRYDLLFTLYDEYRRLPDVDVDFDRFLFWGEMLVSDFNDVDRYLVDADALFVNVKRLREISSNYLTPKQLDVIARYWGEKRTVETIDRFWNHLERNHDNRHHARFVKLWEVLQPLYHAYRQRLASRGLASSGMLYRNAVEILDPSSDYELPYSRCIFVGFNVLSTSEITIFSRLQRLGKADFYWDFNSRAFDLKDSRAARFMNRNVKEFPSMYALPETERPPQPRINIVGVPSNTAQVKLAGQQLREWMADGAISDRDNAINTAVVLPDESLFIPMIHSVPEEITTLNVTMGFPMRLSPMAALLKKIVSLHLRSRLRNDERVYFWEDVAALLSTPLLRAVSPEKCTILESEIQRQRLFTIPASLIVSMVPEFKPVFRPIENPEDRRCVYSYLAGLCDFMKLTIGPSDDMQLRFIESYSDAIDELHSAAERFGIDMHGQSFIRLVERATSSDTINFIGEPLHGLQIMGVLETRALDFDNIIMLSMNERIFPRKHYSRSFIPDALRYGFGMATLDFQESIFAYYFYRLISRARNVTLIYDARSVGGIKSSEMSRYIAQILYFFDRTEISHRLCVYQSQQFNPEEITVSKNKRIERLLDRFKTTDGPKLSASALNTYLNCPLEFYLKYVEGYNGEDEIIDYMDSSTYGSIVHEVAQHIYESWQDKDNPQPVTITRSMLEPLTEKNSTLIDRIIVEAINRVFHKRPVEKQLEPLTGESLVLGKVIKATIAAMLKADMELTPFTFVKAEYKMSGSIEILPGININVTQIVDRIDIVNGTMRFVDYKTGSDKLSATSVDQIFTPAKDRQKAILQLLFYCHIYNMLQHDDRAIRPVIYQMQSIMTNGIQPIMINKTELSDYHQVYDRFKELLKDTVLEIFDTSVPFKQSCHNESCKFCQFKPMCGRDNTDY